MPSLRPGFAALPRSAAIAISSPDALDVEADERVARENALLDIGGEEAAGIVAAEAQGGSG
jgi:hypothetical protein